MSVLNNQTIQSVFQAITQLGTQKSGTQQSGTNTALSSRINSFSSEALTLFLSLIPNMTDAQVANAIKNSSGLDNLWIKEQIFSSFTEKQIQAWWTGALPSQINDLDQASLKLIVPKLSLTQAADALLGASSKDLNALVKKQLVQFVPDFTNEQTQAWWRVTSWAEINALSPYILNMTVPRLTGAQVVTAMASSALTVSMKQQFAAALTRVQIQSWWSGALPSQINNLDPATLKLFVSKLSLPLIAKALGTSLGLSDAVKVTLNVLVASLSEYSIQVLWSGASSRQLNDFDQATLNLMAPHLLDSQVKSALGSGFNESKKVKFCLSLTKEQIQEWWSHASLIEINAQEQARLNVMVPKLSQAQMMEALQTSSGISASVRTTMLGLLSESPKMLKSMLDKLDGMSPTLVIDDYQSSSHGLGNSYQNVLISHSAKNSYGVGNAQDNIIIGNVGNNVLMGGKGNDILIGGEGSDDYIFNKGDGQDLILDYSPPGSPRANFDRLQLPDITLDQLRLTHQGNDLVIDITGSTDRITVVDWFADAVGSNQLEGIETADKTIRNTDINKLVESMSHFSAPVGVENTYRKQDNKVHTLLTTSRSE